MRQYGEIANPIPGEKTFAADIKFVPQNLRTGEDYRFPVRLGLEQGATYNTDHGAFSLNSAVDGDYQVANLEGAEIALRATLSYGEMSRLSQSKGRSSRAYDQGIGLKIANLTDAGEQHRDMNLWYGAGSSGLANIGVISAVAVAASSGVVTVNISRATFIPGFWQDFRNGSVDVYTSGGSQRNTNALLKVTAVDRDRCRVQLTGNTSDAAAVAANDVIFFRGGRASSMVGVQAICENSGSLFGISAATYPQWKAVQYAVGGSLSFDKVAEGLSAAADNGLSEGCTLYVNPRTWTDLMTDEVALRRYVGERSEKAKPGFNELEFVMNCGPVKIKPYRYMKQGLAFAIPTQEMHRVGSTDLTFTLPGSPNEFFYRELDSQAGAEIRIYTDQAVVCESPYHVVEFTGVQNTADCVPA
jgi:hypothetical protein